MSDMKEQCSQFENALLTLDRVGALRILSAIRQESPEFERMEILISAALESIGLKWEEGGISLSQVYMCGVICEELVESFLPMNEKDRKSFPKMAIAVLEDRHALGKRIVSSIVRSKGYLLLDYGSGLTAGEIVEKALEDKVDVLLISTLMLSSALKVAVVMDLLRQSSSRIKVIAGGAPFRLDPGLWRNVGADADGGNATQILSVIAHVMGGADE